MKSFVLYVDYMEQIELLDMEQRGILLTAIMQYAAGEELPSMDNTTAMAFSFIKGQLDRDAEKYEQVVEKRRAAGRMGGRPPKANGSEEKAKKANGFSEKQTKAKKAVDVDDDVDVDVDVDDINKKNKQKKFVKPTVEEVRAYCEERHNSVNAQAFVDFYESKGWLIGKNHMKDWKAAVRTWERKDKEQAKPATKFDNFDQRQNNDYEAYVMNKFKQKRGTDGKQ